MQRLESATPHHQRRSPQRGRWHRQKDKNRSPSAKTKPGRDVIHFTSAHNCSIILDINNLSRMRSIASLPCKILWEFDAVFYQEIILSSGIFRRETASGFYPWGNVGGPRKRVAEGLCGWRHGNSFPMTQSAQSHRQMRSIPRCSKAVFSVFVFDFIHDSTTCRIYAPSNYPLSGC